MTENQTRDAKRAAFEKSRADLTASYEQMYDELDFRDMDEVARMSNHELRALRVILEPRLRLLEIQMEGVNEKLARLVELAELSAGVEPHAEQKPAGADAVYDFTTLCCDIECSENDGDGTKTLHAAYLRFCRADGVPSSYWLGERDFRERLIDLGFEQAKSNGRRFWRALKLLPIDAVRASITDTDNDKD